MQSVESKWIPLKELSYLTNRSVETLRAEFRRLAKNDPNKANQMYKHIGERIYANQLYFKEVEDTRRLVMELYENLIYDLGFSNYKIAKRVEAISEFSFSQVYSLLNYYSFRDHETNKKLVKYLDIIVRKEFDKDQ